MKIKPQYCLNGNYFYYEDKQLEVTNRAFRYGDAIFESMFVVSKKIPLLAKHFERLTEAAKYWEMQLPSGFNVERIAKEVERLCNRNRLFQGARVRLTIFRSGEGLYTPVTNAASYLLEVTYFAEQEFTLNAVGWRVENYTEEYKYPVKAGRYKTAQCLLSIKSSIFKQKKTCDEVLLLSPKHEVVEAAAYNVFALKGNVLLTPHLESGCVAGVMRNTVLQYASELGLHTEEVPFSLQILEEAEEVFLTNAVVGLRWVLVWKEKRYFSSTAKRITALLNKKLIEP